MPVTTNLVKNLAHGPARFRTRISVGPVVWALLVATGCGDEPAQLRNGDPDAAFAVVRKQICRLAERCKLFAEYGVAFTMDKCHEYAGRKEIYRDQLDDQTVAALQRCLDSVAAIDDGECEELGDDLLEDMPECTTVGEYLNIFEGDYDDACQRALRKWNECTKADDDTRVQFQGWCSDDVEYLTPSGTKKVAFKSWSDQYLACDPRPEDCLCEGLPSWEDYAPQQ